MSSLETQPSPAGLRRRICATYLALTGAASERGALAWFADRLGVSPKTVGRYVRGRRDPPPELVRRLELLEIEAEESDGPTDDPRPAGSPAKVDRNRRILEMAETASLREVADLFGISAERARQIIRKGDSP
jgi:DNA-binding CsgD family transcriptional regulator